MNTKMNTKMNAKTIILFLITMLFSVTVCSAQGLYSSKTTSDEEDSTSKSSFELRARPDPKDPGPNDNVPLGEGLLILGALSGAYALSKRKRNKKA